MNDQSTNSAADDAKQHDQSQKSDRSIDPSRVKDPRDLVYTSRLDRDPQEILGNPAVAPEMLSEGADLRPDLFRDPEADDTE